MQLTGERVIGIGDAAGMFPIDSDIHDYDKTMINQFNTLIKQYDDLGKRKIFFPAFLWQEKKQEY